MLIGTLVVSLLLCLGLALAVLYVVAAPHLRASGNELANRLAERIDAAVQRIEEFARPLAGRVLHALRHQLQARRPAAERVLETARHHVQARRPAAEEPGSAHLPG
ncbi:hypothetical protein CLV92_101235 [Kineococcus xinjiangensis]|uniref:Uncharacterized protein n=1 Tax=Kineococcus xinjiangensis TaxID=512762 RepID=A0A2S6IW04_9ACTN|nr:hypothetical protein [Kineococcus xinjiangensis]PPK98539.1 hypothetical protein CLV92_101235 [Kineococcus xinjiangensis]